MASDRRGHAEARVGIDVRRADKTLHQLVGDVVIFGQELAGKVEGDSVLSMLRDDVLQTAGDMIKRVGPGHRFELAVAAADHRLQQALLEPERLAERRAFRTKLAKICGMIRITGDVRAALSVRRSYYTAANAA